MAAPLVEYESDEEPPPTLPTALPPLELEGPSRVPGRLCHVFVRVPVQGTWLRPVLRSIIDECSAEPTFHPVDEYLSEKVLHVSLTRPAVVAHHELESFVRVSTKTIQSCQVSRYEPHVPAQALTPQIFAGILANRMPSQRHERARLSVSDRRLRLARGAYIREKPPRTYKSSICFHEPLIMWFSVSSVQKNTTKRQSIMQASAISSLGRSRGRTALRRARECLFD